MIIKKKKDTFNDYSVELSWGQLNAIFAALEKDHADPLSDELFAELGWYLQNVPGPGEDEEEYKAAKEAEKQALDAGDETGGAGGGPDPEHLGQELEAPPEDGMMGPEGAESPVPADNTPPAEEADRMLERPPERNQLPV